MTEPKLSNLQAQFELQANAEALRPELTQPKPQAYGH
jgi:hypothetical protein